MSKQEQLIKEISELNINTLTEEDIIGIVCRYGLVADPGWDCGKWTEYKVKDWYTPGIYQTPEQIAQCIMELLKYDINSYLEIGIYQGGSYLLMTNFLKLKNPNIICIGTDISEQFMNADVKPHLLGYHIGTSNYFKEMKFDLVFIDGDHTYKGAKTDWENVGRFAKMTMFHDIVQPSCPELIQFWNELKEGKNYKEYCYHTTGKPVQGIGLIFNSYFDNLFDFMGC